MAQRSALESHIGNELRKHRVAQHMKITEVASLCEVSQGMLSKIENGQTSPSLDMLKRLCQGLGVTMSGLFGNYDRPNGGAQFVRAGEGHEVVRRSGYSQQLLTYRQGPTKDVEAFLFTATEKSDLGKCLQHPGTVFIHVVEGRFSYGHGDKVFEMGPGDSLTFDATVAHGGVSMDELPMKLICVFSYTNTEHPNFDVPSDWDSPNPISVNGS